MTTKVADEPVVDRGHTTVIEDEARRERRTASGCPHRVRKRVRHPTLQYALAYRSTVVGDAIARTRSGPPNQMGLAASRYAATVATGPPRPTTSRPTSAAATASLPRRESEREGDR